MYELNLFNFCLFLVFPPRKTTLILTGMGLVFAVIFYIGTKEPSDCSALEKDLSTAVEESVVSRCTCVAVKA